MPHSKPNSSPSLGLKRTKTLVSSPPRSFSSLTIVSNKLKYIINKHVRLKPTGAFKRQRHTTIREKKPRYRQYEKKTVQKKTIQKMHRNIRFRLKTQMRYLERLKRVLTEKAAGFAFLAMPFLSLCDSLVHHLGEE